MKSRLQICDIIIHNISYPRCSMSGLFTYIYHKFRPNVGKYTIHWAFGYVYFVFLVNVSHSLDVIGTTILVMAVQHALFPDVAPPFKVKPLPQLIFPSGSTSKGSKVREWKFSSWGCFVGFAVLNVVNVSRMAAFCCWLFIVAHMLGRMHGFLNGNVRDSILVMNAARLWVVVCLRDLIF